MNIDMMVDWTKPETWSVLVVDDEVDNLELIAEILHFYGAVARTARNGVEALEILEEFTPCLILLDLSMPRMDGWQTRPRIKAMFAEREMPIVALTAHAMIGDKERVLNAGFDGYISKPVNMPTFMKDIALILQQKEEKKETKMLNWNVLVIEDEADSMELVQGLFDHYGVQSTGVQNAEQALNVLQTTIPDLILVDLELPGMDGWTFLKQLQANPRWMQTPRVAFSAYHSSSLAQKAIDAGFHAYFAKPIDATGFVRELEILVKSSKK